MAPEPKEHCLYNREIVAARRGSPIPAEKLPSSATKKEEKEVDRASPAVDMTSTQPSECVFILSQVISALSGKTDASPGGKILLFTKPQDSRRDPAQIFKTIVQGSRYGRSENAVVGAEKLTQVAGA